MASGALCESCRGKFPLLGQGGVECASCSAFHRVRNLVWGNRFPPQLGGVAARRLQDCYLQLLQEADQYYFQQPTAEVALRPGESKRGEPHAPRSPEVPKEKTDRRSSDRRPEVEHSKDKKKKDKDKDRKRDRGDHPETETGQKERKRHRREEEEKRDKERSRVKAEEGNSAVEPLVPVKEEEVSDFEEGEESEFTSEERVSPSKSPLPRRRPAVSPPRPRSPDGPPPQAGPAVTGGPPGKWEGPIPGRFRNTPGAGGSDSRLPGIAPKVRPKKKKKNKGKKHRARQEARREARGRR